MILKNMNSLKITNTNESVTQETEILNGKHTKSVYKSPILHKLGSVVKKTTGSGGTYETDAFTLQDYDPS